MNEYRRFVLAPGQTPPVGSAGIVLTTGWLVWHGEALMFPPSIESYAMAAEEIAEYKAILALPSQIAEAAGSINRSVFHGLSKAKLSAYIDTHWVNISDSRETFKRLAELVYDICKRQGWWTDIAVDTETGAVIPKITDPKPRENSGGVGGG